MNLCRKMLRNLQAEINVLAVTGNPAMIFCHQTMSKSLSDEM
jgi:hypothetical protein